MSIITGGLGGGSGISTVNVLGAATTGATVAVLPQTGLLPQTGGLSVLLLATIAIGLSIAISLVGTKLYRRFN